MMQQGGWESMEQILPCKGWAAVYCRLSREDEDKTARESESIRNQRELLLNWAQAHGYRVYRVYIDEDYSGIDRGRPGFNAMLADAQAGKFEVILAKTQSRFTRDMELVERYLHGLFRSGVCGSSRCWIMSTRKTRPGKRRVRSTA